METTTEGPDREPHKRPKMPRRPNVQELIRSALVEAEGDERAAVSSLVDQALADIEYVREIFALAVQALNKQTRHSARGTARQAAQGAASSVRSLGTALARPLLDFPLQDGTLLKDAYRPQVERSASQFGQQGKTLIHLSRWLVSISAKMDESKTVGESLDEVSARQIFDETAED